MRKHAAKILLALFFAAFVASLWLGADWLGRIKRRSGRVEGLAIEYERYLLGEIGAPEVSQEFQSGEILSRIQKDWASGFSARDYPPNILMTPGSRSGARVPGRRGFGPP